jgi:hypothetical protein
LFKFPRQAFLTFAGKLNMAEANFKAFNRRRKLPANVFISCVFKRPVKMRPAIRLATLLLTLAIPAFIRPAAAADSNSMAVSAGTWKVTQYTSGAGEPASELTLKLQVDGGSLTGTLVKQEKSKRKAHVCEWPIKAAKLEGDEISFTVSRPIGARSGDVITTYRGRISGDTIKGTFSVEVLGQSFSRNWEAARLKE